jgi:uncharacterized repeat protein (TIGR02543 family)
MMKLALSLYLVSLTSWIPPVQVNLVHDVTFTILNDTQSVTVLVEDGQFLFNAPSFELQPNVRLNGWYLDTELLSRADFDLPIMENKIYYAAWDYLITAFEPATLRMSEEGSRFKSETLVLSFDLYAPLAEDISYQWETTFSLDEPFVAIPGANASEFSPFVNGTKYYRIRYSVPLNDDLLSNRRTFYSAPIQLTIYGQESFTLLFILVGLTMMGIFISFFLVKRKVEFETFSGEPMIPLRFKIGEDASLLPKAIQKGYTFQGWYMDETLSEPYQGIRMPTRSFKLYAKYKKRKNI